MQRGEVEDAGNLAFLLLEMTRFSRNSSPEIKTGSDLQAKWLSNDRSIFSEILSKIESKITKDSN